MYECSVKDNEIEQNNTYIIDITFRIELQLTFDSFKNSTIITSLNKYVSL